MLLWRKAAFTDVTPNFSPTFLAEGVNLEPNYCKLSVMATQFDEQGSRTFLKVEQTKNQEKQFPSRCLQHKWNATGCVEV